jgi:hypothetical protein
LARDGRKPGAFEWGGALLSVLHGPKCERRELRYRRVIVQLLSVDSGRCGVNRHNADVHAH